MCLLKSVKKCITYIGHRKSNLVIIIANSCESWIGKCTIYETQPLDMSVTLIGHLKVIRVQRSHGQLQDHI